MLTIDKLSHSVSKSLEYRLGKKMTCFVKQCKDHSSANGFVLMSYCACAEIQQQSIM